jgi:hypothetical protein
MGQPMGKADGTTDGAAIGEGDEKTDGAADGATNGANDGAANGAADGSTRLESARYWPVLPCRRQALSVVGTTKRAVDKGPDETGALPRQHT